MRVETPLRLRFTLSYIMPWYLVNYIYRQYCIRMSEGVREDQRKGR
jgi:hypothetical protein